MLGEVFYWVFNMSIAATICMVPILLLRRIKKIPRRFFLWLWLIPLIRMCIPVGISGRYGIMTLLSQFTTKTVTVYQVRELPPLTMVNIFMGAKSYFPITYKVNLLEKLFKTASVIWLAVAMASILTLVIIYSVTQREMKDARHWKENLYLSDRIRTPAVYGILKPRIILPIEYTREDLTHILAHERAHIKRKDNFIRLFSFAVVCLHWFNPMAWLMLKLLCADIELACDEAVLSTYNETQRREYAHALLSSAEKTNVFTASFGGSRIRTRIDRILSYKKISLCSGIAYSALILTIFYILLTNAS